MLNRIPQKVLGEYYQRAKVTRQGAAPDTAYLNAQPVA